MTGPRAHGLNGPSPVFYCAVTLGLLWCLELMSAPSKREEELASQKELSKFAKTDTHSNQLQDFWNLWRLVSVFFTIAVT